MEEAEQRKVWTISVRYVLIPKSCNPWLFTVAGQKIHGMR